MEQILPANDLSEETVAVIMMLYKNTKVKVRSRDEDTDYFDIIVGVLQEDPLALYFFIIYLDYMLRASIDLMKKSWQRKEAEDPIYPTPPLGQDMTQGQFLSGV